MDGRVRDPGALPAPAAAGRLPPLRWLRLGRLIVVDLSRRLVGCRVPAGFELAHLEDEDEPERGPETAKGRELVGVDLWHAAHDARRWSRAADGQ
jgi:hypothetical protein